MIDGVTYPLLGASRAMQEVRSLVDRVAPTQLAVLVHGPTGSGKELVAQALHTGSGRPGPLVAVNVCATPDTLFDDALFGHVRGAFTGAHTGTVGYVGEAHGGTIFFDEIGSLSLVGQSKLLRVVETGEYRPLGSVRDRRSDFRVVAATNEPLATLVRDGRFRDDLVQRLGAVIIRVPALRERLDDLPILARHFLRSVDPSGRLDFADDVFPYFASYDWPGNVRELKQTVARAAILARSAIIDVRDVAPTCAVRHLAATMPATADKPTGLLAVLERVNWDTQQAALMLGISRSAVYRRMAREGITGRGVPGRPRVISQRHSG
jgi:DNA-binding NtrC family response regulator